MSNILITGGTGLIGSELTKELLNQGHQIAYLSRSKSSGKIKKYFWDYKKKALDIEALEWANVIIHLAGASVADKRWSKKRKKEIYDSRILTTRLIRDKLTENNIKIDHFISASATGFYPQTSDISYSEESDAGTDYLGNVVKDWEEEIFEFKKLNICTSVIRISVVLSEKGGAFSQLLTPIKMGFGAALGTGKQAMPWIHIDDLVQIFAFAMNKKLEGVYNAAATMKVTNQHFNELLAQKLRKKLWMPKVPSFAMKLLLGEMGLIVLTGTYVSNDKIKQVGFKFKYDQLDSAFDKLLSK